MKKFTNQKSKIKIILLVTFLMLGFFILITQFFSPQKQVQAQSAGYQWPTGQHFPSAKMGYYMLNGYPAAEGKDAYFTWFANNYDLVINMIDYNAKPDPYISPVRGEILAYLKSVNPNIVGTIYEYFHSISPIPGFTGHSPYLSLLQDTFDRNIEPEDWFLHYRKNTPTTEPGVAWAASAFNDDKFHYVYVDSTKITDGAYRATDNESFGQSAGSILYLGHGFKFKEINFNFSTPASADWNGVWEYWNGNAWTSLTITSDTTNDLTQNGKIEFWQPPANWKRVGNINGEKPVYWVRLRTINPGTTKPVALTIKGQDYQVGVDISGTSRLVVPGWDPSQDQGQNGGVANDGIRDTLPDEISNFSGSSALIKAHSRPIVDRSSYSSNINNVDFQRFFVNFHVNLTDALGVGGFYWDVIDGTNPSALFGNPLYGVNDSLMLEYPSNVLGAWRSNIVQTLQYSKQQLENRNKLLGGNTGRQAANLEIERAEHLALRESFYGQWGHKSSYDLEQSSYWKILTSDSFYRVVGKEGIRNILDFRFKFNTLVNNDFSTQITSTVSATETNVINVESTALFPDAGVLWLGYEKIKYTGKSATSFTGLTRGIDGTVPVSVLLENAKYARVTPDSNVQREKIYILSLFYIVQNPATDYFSIWKDCCPQWYYTNAQAEARAFFVNAIRYDIGQPTASIPSGYSALSTTASDSTWGVYVVGQGSDFKVYARDYTKAITIAKPLSSTGYGDASATVVQLPVTADNPSGRYYRVKEDATLDMTPLTSISLRSVEGAILVKESAMMGVSLSKSVDKTSAQSGDTLTYTISYTVGTQNATNAILEDPIPNGTTFIAGSATNGGNSDGTKVIWNLGNLAPGASGTVSFQVKIP